MAIKQTFNKAPKVKIVPTVDNIGLASAEEGEIYYDIGTTAIMLRTDDGWVKFSQD